MGVTTSPGAKQSCDYPSWEVLKSRLFPFSESSPDIWEEGDGKSPPNDVENWDRVQESWEKPEKAPRGWNAGNGTWDICSSMERPRGKDEGERMKGMETGKTQADYLIRKDKKKNNPTPIKIKNTPGVV